MKKKNKVQKILTKTTKTVTSTSDTIRDVTALANVILATGELIKTGVDTIKTRKHKKSEKVIENDSVEFDQSATFYDTSTNNSDKVVYEFKYMK